MYYLMSLYYAVCDVFPGVDVLSPVQKSIAEQFTKADSVLNGNYDYSYFDYGKMQGGLIIYLFNKM
mgnify:CR=1 FL=1